MKHSALVLFTSLAALVIVSCGSSNGTTSATSSSGNIAILGVVSSGTADTTKGMPSSCPDDLSGGNSLSVNPVADSFHIGTKYVRLLKQGSSDYYEIPGCTHATATEAEANSVTIGSSTTTICDLGTTALTSDAIATYNGIEMAIYYVEMTVPLIVPTLSATVANYPVRMYFNDDTANGILARDVLIYDAAAAKWGWINWDNTTVLSYVGVDARPSSLLDGFANDEFWCADCSAYPELCPAEANRRQCSFDHPTWSYKDPVTLNTTDSIEGNDFAFTGTFTIESASGEKQIVMSFDLANTLSAWASQHQIDTNDTTIDLFESCGFHPLFPRVTITTTP